MIPFIGGHAQRIEGHKNNTRHFEGGYWCVLFSHIIKQLISILEEKMVISYYSKVIIQTDKSIYFHTPLVYHFFRL